MLAQTVTNYPAVGLNGWWPHDQAKKIATTCHFATCFWLFRDEFSREPSEDELIKVGNAQLAVGRMLPYGTRLRNPMRGSLTLTPGSVFVFAHNNVAEHSCVAIDATTLSGYNQQGWYSLGGGNHTHSTHTTAQLMWGTGAQVNHARRVSAAGWYELFAIPEGIAKATIRGLAQ